MIEVQQDPDGVGACIILRPNLSASWRTNVLFVLILMGVMLVISLVFAYLGAWPVLPFAGAESLFVMLVLYFWYSRYAQQEVLTFDAGYLLLERGRHFPRQQWRFERFWLRGHVAQLPRQLPRVRLRCRQQQVEIGRYLNEDDRKHLVRILRNYISLL